ncbi:MAG TPA: MFS transporter [Solirubrobacterales bacterium]|nr:MFS transporter [Solirubrobacterales bacterium]
MSGRTTPQVVALAVCVGVVLADSSIVTLALPEVLREFDTSVFGVSWVLTAYNIFLAALLIPAARLAREHPSRVWSLGLVGFALASLACALAPSVAPLIVARCVQAAGGAAVIAGAIELLARIDGTHRGAARLWGAAGTAGLALGPALGGVLTEALSWQSIFLLQVPLLLLLPFAAEPAGRPEAGPAGARDRRPELALGLLSAGLTAALFLLVVLLTEGWGLTAIEAAAVVSVIPVAALLAGRIHLSEDNSGPIAVGGAIAIGGGLAALGVIPGASADLVVAPQLLIGAGLALALPVLTAAALGRRDPDGERAAETLAARHAGIVVGILLLTPVLSLQLESQQDAGTSAGAALLLDAPLSPQTKLEIGNEVDASIEAAEGQLPDLAPAFASVDVDADDQAALDALETGIGDQLERAATHAFSLPFLGAAVLALLALIPMRHLATGSARESD